jgi:Ferritin-like
MILLRQSMLDGITGDDIKVEAVREKLQSAIELEHATLPPYLYALYSLDPAKNGEIVSIIRSVVTEEMLHMTLAANVLNAIGGSPDIDNPKFIPNYPGPLPGGVEDQLTVQLAPFSMAQLETFLTIEEPVDPLQFKMAASLTPQPVTIGDFYRQLIKAIEKLGPPIFVPGPRNQVGPNLVPESVVVTDVPSARQALTTIVEQGEGTSKTPLEIVGNGYAHYYRFMQIKKGHLLEPEGDTFAWDGPAVPFDPAGVYPVPTQLPGWSYQPGSAAAAENDMFNYTYTNLLKALDALFNGQNTSAQMNRTLGLMMSLKELAVAMMSGIPDSTRYNGPTFQYQPTSPRAGCGAEALDGPDCETAAWNDCGVWISFAIA